jgi:hypothetical protein
MVKRLVEIQEEYPYRTNTRKEETSMPVDTEKFRLNRIMVIGSCVVLMTISILVFANNWHSEEVSARSAHEQAVLAHEQIKTKITNPCVFVSEGSNGTH